MSGLHNLDRGYLSQIKMNQKFRLTPQKKKEKFYKIRNVNLLKMYSKSVQNVFNDEYYCKEYLVGYDASGCTGEGFPRILYILSFNFFFKLG